MSENEEHSVLEGLLLIGGAVVIAVIIIVLLLSVQPRPTPEEETCCELIDFLEGQPLEVIVRSLEGKELGRGLCMRLWEHCDIEVLEQPLQPQHDFYTVEIPKGCAEGSYHCYPDLDTCDYNCSTEPWPDFDTEIKCEDGLELSCYGGDCNWTGIYCVGWKEPQPDFEDGENVFTIGTFNKPKLLNFPVMYYINFNEMDYNIDCAEGFTRVGNYCADIDFLDALKEVLAEPPTAPECLEFGEPNCPIEFPYKDCFIMGKEELNTFSCCDSSKEAGILIDLNSNCLCYSNDPTCRGDYE